MPLDRSWSIPPALRQMTADVGGPDPIWNFAGDWSSSPILATYEAEENQLIVHMSVVIKDRARRFQPDGFGGGSALSDGFEFCFRGDGGQINPDGILPGNVIRRNSDFLRWAEHIETMGSDMWGTSNRERGFAAHYEPYGAWGIPIYLPRGAAVCMNLTDDLSFLTEFAVNFVAINVSRTHAP